MSGVNVLAQLLSILMVAKHWSPERIHYLLPALCLAGFNWTLFWLYFNQMGNALGKKRLLNPLKIGMLIIIVILSIPTIFEIRGRYLALNNNKNKMLSLEEEVNLKFKDYAKVYYYGSSSRAYALKFGVDYSSSRYPEILKKMFPDVYFFNVWNGTFYDFENKTILFSDFCKKYTTTGVIFQGETYKLKSIKVNIKKVLGEGREVVNLVVE